MRSRATLVGAIALIALIAAGTEQARACSCADAERNLSLERWDGAVTAKLLQVDVRDPERGRATFAYKLRRVFKGRHEYGLRRGLHLRIRSWTSGATCGLPRREGRRYGLLLYEWRGTLQANLCTVVSRRALREAARDRGAERLVPRRRCATGGGTRNAGR